MQNLMISILINNNIELEFLDLVHLMHFKK